jgi:hypothetical protein
MALGQRKRWPRAISLAADRALTSAREQAKAAIRCGLPTASRG